jgi:tetratricopeptide (TPR) repeat protein
MKITRLILSITLLAAPSLQADTHPPFVGQDLRGVSCAGFSGGYGPYDYTLRGGYAEQLLTVESHHFNRDVESLTRGQTTMLPYGDLAYTLRAWPNHHRALNSMSRYQLQMSRKGQAIEIPAECWFQRAIRYSPKDATTYMLYGMYLQKAGKLDMARDQYQAALTINPNSADANYNYGLLLVTLKEYEAAKKHAKKAYDAGFPLPGLRNQLTRAGQWP